MHEERNRKIRENGKATRERRSHMDCRVISVKIQESRLSNTKLEKLKRFFLEGKWLYNAVVTSETLTLDNTKTVYVKVKDVFEERENKYLSAQMKQSVIESVKTNVSNLSKAKNRGLKVGRLRFKSECNEINLKQYGQTLLLKIKTKLVFRKLVS